MVSSALLLYSFDSSYLPAWELSPCGLSVLHSICVHIYKLTCKLVYVGGKYVHIVHSAIESMIHTFEDTCMHSCIWNYVTWCTYVCILLDG